MTDFNRGSEWRKWDLHIHTPSSDGVDVNNNYNEELIKKLKEKEIKAIAITDHFVIDKQRIENLRILGSDITIFPGVEVRIIHACPNLHTIMIFSEKIDLQVLQEDFNVFCRTDRRGESPETQYFLLYPIIKFANEHKGLIILHGGNKHGGIEEQIKNNEIFLQNLKKDILEVIDILEIPKYSDIARYKEKVFSEIGFSKPLIMCSDNHNVLNDNEANELGRQFTWIKANTTFDGLKQAVNYPDGRISLEPKPLKLEMAEKNKKIYIDSISVKQRDNALNKTIKWFDFDIPINIGLTVIIGKKGGGKSALSDIIAHLCKCKTMTHASFLHSSRFRKTLTNYAKDYIGTLTWLDNEKNILGLEETKYDTTIENAQYMPQKYIENLCGEVLADDFQKEINALIFSYIIDTDKRAFSDLKEYMSSKTSAQRETINIIKQDLEKINDQIISLEKKLTENYKREIQDNIIKLKNDIKREEEELKKEPIITEVTEEDAENLKKQQKIEEKIDALEKEIKETKKNIVEINVEIEVITTLRNKMHSIINNIKLFNQEIFSSYNKKYPQKEQLSKLQIDSIPLRKQINHKLNSLRTLKYELEKIIGTDTIDLKDFACLLSKETNQYDIKKTDDHSMSLYVELKLEEKNKEILISTLNAKNSEYQQYKKRCEDRKKNIETIKGTAEIVGSLEFYNEEMNKIQSIYNLQYKDVKEQRIYKIKQILAQKQFIVNVYSSEYTPVKIKLENLLSDMNISFNAEMQINNIYDKKNNLIALSEKLLPYINKNFEGFFKGSITGLDNMNNLIGNIDFKNTETILSFINNVLDKVYPSLDKSEEIVKDKKGFYNYLTSMEYIDIDYKLTMNNISLRELSAGERGIVLLVFYLSLSNKNIPLIIDQPEDNLDNESIYNKLVKCILEAKTKRQIIIVTHNPNIAIACDAEEIIYSSIDKINQKITYVSGSIEDNEIKKHVINVLEGTIPAFYIRQKRYDDEIQKWRLTLHRK